MIIQPLNRIQIDDRHCYNGKIMPSPTPAQCLSTMSKICPSRVLSYGLRHHPERLLYTPKTSEPTMKDCSCGVITPKEVLILRQPQRH